jgi:bifunctional DNA-binding transcriptional regulator/antitoxin component of YhaV-PrlF toxin-antitoxin module
MKFATFTSTIVNEQNIRIPNEVREKLLIEPGDKIEITIKKIKSRKLDLLLAENPLYKLLKTTKQENV